VTFHNYDHVCMTCIYCGITAYKARSLRRYECRRTNKPSTINIKSLRRLIARGEK